MEDDILRKDVPPYYGKGLPKRSTGNPSKYTIKINYTQCISIFFLTFILGGVRSEEANAFEEPRHATNISIRQQSDTDSGHQVYEYSDEDASHVEDPAPIAGGSTDTSMQDRVPARSTTPMRPPSTLVRGRSMRQTQNAVRRSLNVAAFEQIDQKRMHIRLKMLHAKLQVREKLGLLPDLTEIADDIYACIMNLKDS